MYASFATPDRSACGSRQPRGDNSAIHSNLAVVGDAKTWERACRHIALFLWSTAERGLASVDHEVSAVRTKPTKHFIEQCDTKLWDEDLSDVGNAFAASDYDAYLAEVSAYAGVLGLGDYESKG